MTEIFVLSTAKTGPRHALAIAAHTIANNTPRDFRIRSLSLSNPQDSWRIKDYFIACVLIVILLDLACTTAL